MSLTITVRPNGATSGGDTHELPADGDNGNQEIDTKGEAEAALAFLPEQSADTPADKINKIVVGDKEYTRAQLIEIRDKPAAPSDSESGSVMGDGPSHGIFIEGGYQGGLGDLGHNGGSVRFGYRPGFTLLNGDTRLTLDPSLGLDIGHYGMEYETPGGEMADSSFTRYGGILGLDLRIIPPILDHRLWASLGARFGVGGFGTADSTTVSTPTGCTPDEFGRQECEPGAGPQTGNAGTTGLINPDAGSSRGTSGAYLYTGIPLTLGFDIARGAFGNLQATGSFEPGFTQLLPTDGHGFGYWSLGGFLGFRANFGGGAVEKSNAPADKDGDGVTDEKDKCPGTLAGVEVGEDGCEKEEGVTEIKGATIDATVSAADDAQQFTVKFNPPVTGEVKSAKIVDAKGKTVTEAEVDPTKLNQTGEVVVKPKAKLEAGDYTVVINMEVDGKPAVAKAPLKVAGDFKVSDFGTSLKGNTAPGASFSVEQNLSAEGTLTVVYQKKTDTGKRGAIAGKDDAIGKMNSGQSKRENLTVKDLPPGEYFVDFVYESNGTKVVRTTAITVAEKPKTADVSDIKILTGTSPYQNDPLSVKVTLKTKAAADTKVKVNVGNASAEGTIKKDSDSVDVQVWGYGEAMKKAGRGTFPVKATPEGGTEFSGPSVTVGIGGGGPGPTPKPKVKL
jgi:hypothetical protein